MDDTIKHLLTTIPWPNGKVFGIFETMDEAVQTMDRFLNQLLDQSERKTAPALIISTMCTWSLVSIQCTSLNDDARRLTDEQLRGLVGSMTPRDLQAFNMHLCAMIIARYIHTMAEHN